MLLGNTKPQHLADLLAQGQCLPWVETLLQYTEESEDILDLGSGSGQHAAILARSGRRLTLLDWSQENVDFSRRLFESMGVQGRFLQGDMTQPLPFQDESFDTVFSCGVFEYFSDAQIVAILKEAFRICRKRVIIMVPNAWSMPYRIGKWHMEHMQKWQWGGERPFSSLRPYFRSLGVDRPMEFTVGTKLSLNFLKMRGGNRMKEVLIKTLRLKDHSRPARLRQGYLLVSVGVKPAEGRVHA